MLGVFSKKPVVLLLEYPLWPKMVFSTGYIPRPVSDNLFPQINFKCITGKIIDVAPPRSHFKETSHLYHEDTKAPFSVQSLLYLMSSIPSV